MNLKIKLVIVLTLLTGKVLAVETPSCSILNSLTQRLYRYSYHFAWDPDIFSCPSEQYELSLAFYTLERIAFSKNKENYEPNLRHFAQKNLKKLVYKTKPHKDMPWAVAVARTKSGKITLFPAFFGNSLYGKISTLVHEGRHLDKDDPSHVVCDHGADKGIKGCDEKFYGTPDQGSGYNRTFSYFWWLRDAGINHDLEKTYLDKMLRRRLLNDFNNVDTESVKKFAP